MADAVEGQGEEQVAQPEDQVSATAAASSGPTAAYGPGAGEEDGEAEPEDGADRRILPDPGEPTASQREEHCAEGHIPYRSWCSDCVEGRSTGEQHRARKGVRQVCVFSCD